MFFTDVFKKSFKENDEFLKSKYFFFCAGRENRTPVSSLARTCSTTKPYPLYVKVVYDIWLFFTIKRILFSSQIYAPVVKWISQWSSEPLLGVRIPPGAPK